MKKIHNKIKMMMMKMNYIIGIDELNELFKSILLHFVKSHLSKFNMYNS